MLNFGIIFLDWLSEQMKNLPENEVYRLSFSGMESDEILLNKLDSYSPFIPEEFEEAFYY